MCNDARMCHSDDGRPPAPPVIGELGQHGDLALTADDGNVFDAYEAHPAAPSRRGIVILPDNRGMHAYYKDLAKRFADTGFHAVTFDYYARTAGRGDRSEAFDYVPHWKQAQKNPNGVDADVRASAAHLRAAGVNVVFTVGFCFGGGMSWRQSAMLDGVAGCIGFYGLANGVLPVRDQLRAPLLMFLGGEDPIVNPADFDVLLSDLASNGIASTRHVYPGAPHSFFDRTYAEHGDECADAWHRILEFTDAIAPR